MPHDAWDERFEHPARTWASASHRSFTLQATGVAMANATYMLTGSPGSRQLNRVCAPRSGRIKPLRSVLISKSWWSPSLLDFWTASARPEREGGKGVRSNSSKSQLSSQLSSVLAGTYAYCLLGRRVSGLRVDKTETKSADLAWRRGLQEADQARRASSVGITFARRRPNSQQREIPVGFLGSLAF